MYTMASSKINKHIHPLHINGLDGRVLQLPAPKDKNKQILLLYGHHASLERISGTAEVLNRYGAVTTPDLPGFGGMDSFYKIGKSPSIDNYADYLAAFVKMKYKHRRVSIAAMSFSFLIVTRMLQKYPELAKKVDLLVSFAGFVHRDEFRFSFWQYWSLRTLAWTLKWRPTAFLARYLVLNKWMIQFAYTVVADRHTKMQDANKEQLKQRIAFETNLWQINDLRTRMKTITAMLTADLCNAQVKLSVKHIVVPDDRYFNNDIVEQHMRIIYKDFEAIESRVVGHMPTVIATAKEAAPLIPPRLRRLLRS